MKTMREWMYRFMFSWPRHQLELSGQLHTSAAFTLGERAPGTDWIGCWVDPRTGLDYTKKWKFLTLSGLELRLFSVVQPLGSRYADCATAAHSLIEVVKIDNTKSFSQSRENIETRSWVPRDSESRMTVLARTQKTFTREIIPYIYSLSLERRTRTRTRTRRGQEIFLFSSAQSCPGAHPCPMQWASGRFR
jgi:hypothetical protein